MEEDDLMFCPLCKEELTEIKDPRSLDCDHSYCFSCLQQQYDGCEEKIACLQCKVESPIPSGGLAAIVCSKFLIRDMRKRNSNRDAATNKTQGEYQRLLNEMKNHGVVILPPGTALKDYRYEKSGALLYALFYREKGNEAEFKHAADLFCKLATLFKAPDSKANSAMKSDTMIGFVAIDLDKCLTQSEVEINVNVNDIALWETDDYRKIKLGYIESLGKVENLAFMRYNPKLCQRYLENTPPDRAKVSMCCPSQGCCNAETKWDWHCVGCLTLLDYDLKNDEIFCDCGAWDITERTASYEVQCGSASHAMTTVSHSQLRGTLQQLQKVKEINILVLGETGVGKSTWINAVANYVTSSTLEEAKSDYKFQCLIESGTDRHSDSTFNSDLTSISSSSDDIRDVKTSITLNRFSHPEEGAVATNTEFQNSDWDADTKQPSSYLILTKKQNVRIIDTPGVGNPAGRESDKVHCEDILYFLSNSSFKELHGICILMKCNTTRLTIEFRYCLTLLFKQLHKSAAQNILFCFTFSRLTQYGRQTTNTLSVLAKMLSDIQRENPIDNRIDIKIGENVFFFDNEVFEYLCNVRKGVNFNDIETADYKRSWTHSKAETERLFQCVESLNPYSTKKSSSIYEARHLITKIIEPTLSLQQMLGRNTKSMETAAKNYEMNTAIEADNKILYFKMEKKLPRELTSTCKQCKHCLVTRTINPLLEQHKQEIHTSEKICEENINWFSKILYFFRIFSRTCKNCQCPSEHHRYTAYSEITVCYYKSVDSIQAHKNEIDANKRNLAKIATIVAKFSIFLQRNALADYSDVVEDELRSEMFRITGREITETYSREDRDRALETLLLIRDNHAEEKKKCEDLDVIQPEEIPKLRDELYQIPETGEEIKKLVDIDEKAKSSEMSKTEKILKRAGKIYKRVREANVLGVANYMNPFIKLA